MTLEIDLNTIINSGLLLLGVAGVRGIFGIKKEVADIGKKVVEIDTGLEAHKILCEERHEGIHGRLRTHEKTGH